MFATSSTSGTPDDGFRSSPPNTTPSPGFWSPPEAGEQQPAEALGGGGDFLIGAGFYVPRRPSSRVSVEAGRQAISYSYLDQPDWPLPVQIAGDLRTRTGLSRRGPSGSQCVEDPDLLEVALGGPDTSQRLRFIPRSSAEPLRLGLATAWDRRSVNGPHRGHVRSGTMRLSPAAMLQGDLHRGRQHGRPLRSERDRWLSGADNQLIRPTVSAPAGAPQPWSGATTTPVSFTARSVLPDVTRCPAVDTADA